MIRPAPLLPRILAVLACGFALVAVGRVVLTYRVFCETADEHAHIVGGMEWIDRGSYTYAIEHPPLARVAAALLPHLAGLRSHGFVDMIEEKNAILYGNGHYLRNLALARAGILPFLLLASATVWAWTRRLSGDASGLLAMVLFTTLPPVLAHSGLATTDAALMATHALAVLFFCLWLEGPTLLRGALVGGGVALAILSKFSAFLFLPGAGLAILLARWIAGESSAKRKPATLGERLGSLLLALATASFLLSAAYRFSPRPLIEGVRRVAWHSQVGHPAYLLGQYSQTGWWYYFPVALGVKTTLAFLLLAGAGAAVGFRQARRARDCRPLAPAAAALALLLASLPSKIDIGIRHLLPIYPLLAILGGLGTVSLWRLARFQPLGRSVAAGLLLWHVVASIRAHPDYLAHFNELAGDHPDRILLDSNLDWGQDLLRLSDALRARGVHSVALAYFGNVDLARHGLPPIRPLSADQPTTGWIAISEMCLKDLRGKGAGYAWLKRYEPVALVGRSIRLYYISERLGAAP